MAEISLRNSLSHTGELSAEFPTLVDQKQALHEAALEFNKASIAQADIDTAFTWPSFFTPSDDDITKKNSKIAVIDSYKQSLANGAEKCIADVFSDCRPWSKPFVDFAKGNSIGLPTPYLTFPIDPTNPAPQTFYQVPVKRRVEIAFRGQWNEKPGDQWKSPEGTVEVSYYGANENNTFTYTRPFSVVGPAVMQAHVKDTRFDDNGNRDMRATVRFIDQGIW